MTKDSDFQHLSARFGPPAKVVWLRVGNVRTSDLLAFITSFDQEIRDFAADPVVGLLVLSR
jgi:predicted nuclease of predicted toxin-antitoxin system